MKQHEAVERVLLGESLASIAGALREELYERDGIDPEEDDDTYRYAADVNGFMRDLCRELGERHADANRVGMALREWVESCSDYEAWDALLSSFDFEGRARYVARGRQMFPGPLTAHWTS